MRSVTCSAAIAALLVALLPVAAVAQTPPASEPSTMPVTAAPPPAPGSRLWIVAGAGFSVARAGCAISCDLAGVFSKNRSLLADFGVRVNPKVDAGVEVYFASSRVENQPPIRTTFVVAVGQLRPWHQRGFFVRAGLGIAFIGNGIWNPISQDRLQPPYSTNALGVMYGAGWIFSPYHRLALQLHGTHHIGAIGELATVDGVIVKNVVGNYWTTGMAIVIR